MAEFNFDTVHERKGTHSIKWEFTPSGATDLLPMWVADMDFECPPVVVEAIRRRAAHGIYGYTGVSDEYRASVVNWMKTRHHWLIEPEWIVFINGIVPALNMLMQAFAKPGDFVVVQPPVYYPFYNAIHNNGQRPLLNPLVETQGRYEMDFEDLEEKLKNPRTTMMLLCSPHNPGGRVWTAHELRQVAELCLRYDVLLISDEIHQDLVFTPHHHQVTSRLSEAIDFNTITCTAPSKTFNLAGLQCSNIIIRDEKKRRQFVQALDRNGVFGINPFGSTATIAGYNHGAPWLDELLVYLKGNLDVVESTVMEKMPVVTLMKPEATYLAWLDFRKLRLQPHELEKLIEQKAKVALNQGTIFGESGSGFMRLNFACPRSILVEGLDRIAQAVATV